MDPITTETTSKRKSVLPGSGITIWPHEIQGRITPQALDLEQAVLGGMLLQRDKINDVIDILSTEHFYKTEHQYIFNAIKEMYETGRTIDLITVNDFLRTRNLHEIAGGSNLLAQLTNYVSSAANIEYYARILTQKFIQRELIRVSGEIGQEAFNNERDAFETLDDCEKRLFEIKNKSLKRSFQDIKGLITRTLNDLEERSQTDNEGITGVASGLSTLDAYTAGWQKSDLIILAARPAMGKTAFALTLARNAAVDFKKKVMIFSLEMADVQLVNRLLSGESEVSSDKIRKANLTEEEWQRLFNRTARLSESEIHIDDTPQLSVLDLSAKCRRLASQNGLDLIIVDYLQLLRHSDSSKMNREQEIAFISRSLKGLAKELNVPVIALAQLSRAVETRTQKIPQLSDLRESGSIEQDADMVLFLYRDDYYNKTGAQEEQKNPLENPTNFGIENLTQIVVAKNRHGSVGKAYAKFIGQYSKFVDLDPNEKMNIPDLKYGDSSDMDNSFNSGIIVQSRMNESDLPFDPGDNSKSWSDGLDEAHIDEEF